MKNKYRREFNWDKNIQRNFNLINRTRDFDFVNNLKFFLS